VKELSNSKKTNKKPMGFGAQLAAGLTVYLFPFTWWQHHFKHTYTHVQHLTDYTISSAR